MLHVQRISKRGNKRTPCSIINIVQKAKKQKPPTSIRSKIKANSARVVELGLGLSKHGKSVLLIVDWLMHTTNVMDINNSISSILIDWFLVSVKIFMLKCNSELYCSLVYT